jgi:hypothetical protein
MIPGGDGTPPVLIIHSLDHALAAAEIAVELDCPLTVQSAPGAAAAVGVGWWVALTALVAERYPIARLRLVPDCADEGGAALGAIRRGVPAIRFDGPAAVAAKLQAIAAARGAELDRTTASQAATLDLGGHADPQATIRNWLKSLPFNG